MRLVSPTWRTPIRPTEHGIVLVDPVVVPPAGPLRIAPLYLRLGFDSSLLRGSWRPTVGVGGPGTGDAKLLKISHKTLGHEMKTADL